MGNQNGMVHKIRISVLFFAMVSLGSAARAGVDLKHTFDASYGFGDDGFLHTLSWKPMLGFFKDDALKVGIGLRYSGFVGDASVKYSRVDSAYSGSNAYELFISTPRVNSFNTVFESTYTFWKKLEIGLNIDLFGYGFGRSETGTYVAPTAAAGAQASDTPAFNLLLLGKHDKGQLSSEFFVGYRCPFNLGIRAGFSHLITEHKASASLDGEDRFRHLGNFWFFSVNYLL